MTETVADIRQSINRYFFWGIIVLALIMGLAMIFLRIVDGDEGFYLSAATMLSNGAEPYLDFFFPQMPGLPVFLSPFSGHGWTTLFLARAFGFICHLVLALLIYNFSKSILDNRALNLSLLFLAALSGPLLTWNSLAKPYPLSNLFFFSSFAILTLTIKQRKMNYLMIFLTFAFLALAINIRAIFLIFAPLYFFLLYFYFRSIRLIRLPYYLLTVFLGLVLPSLYAIRLLFIDPGNFLFNNLGFHLLRAEDPGFASMLSMKLFVLAKVLIQPHYFIPLGLAFWSLVIINSKKHKYDYDPWHRMVFQLSMVVAAFIFAVYMIPHPVHVQYFNQTLPFLIVASMPAIRLLLAKSDSVKAVLAAVYLLGILLYPALYILDIRDKYSDYKISNVKKVTQAIRHNSMPEDPILSEWVAYNVLSEREQLAGGEFVGHEYIFSTSIVPRSKYHLLSDEKINAFLHNSVPELVVIKNTPIETWEKELDKNYKIMVKINNVFIYDRNRAVQGE